MLRALWLSLSLLLFTTIATALAHASQGDQVHFGQSITVGEDESAGNLVCIGCSIRMDGSSADIVAIGGSITINGSVKGDVVVIGGAVRLGENASVSGDVVTMGGGFWRDPHSVVGGSITSQSGALVILGLVLMPLIPVILLVALVVWLIGRNRRRAVPARV
jgi:hypothetical protein